ncbi:MAG: dehydrogenase [Actinobacteria bacterium]|nr:dehydrogenase [Actinomycetota bacterium]
MTTTTSQGSVAPADEGAFRRRAQDFLAANAQRKAERGQDSAPRSLEPESAAEIEESKRFQAALMDAGLGFITWPREAGGQGLTGRHLEIFNEEAAAYELPIGIYQIGHGMCAPTILEFGTPEQRATHLPDLLRGSRIWCQLYSEPGAGSDVASLQTRAVRDGDEYVVNGQKVWTSGAHYSDFGILIARTDPEAPKHRGISMFIVDMRTAGIEFRPLRQITGEANFNEVFFTDARIPAANLLGTENDGWRLAVALLMNERVAIGAAGEGPSHGGSAPLIRLARATGQIDDPVVRQGLADVYTRETIMRFIGLRIRAAQKAGRAPGPEGSLAKLAGAVLARRSSDLAIRIAGAAGQAWDSEEAAGSRWSMSVLSAPAHAIAGGTNEIQRGIIGERVLGLPKEPAVDRDLPFKDLRVGTER